MSMVLGGSSAAAHPTAKQQLREKKMRLPLLGAGIAELLSVSRCHQLEAKFLGACHF